MAANVETLKKVACEAIDKAADDLDALSQDIWNHPELCFEEKYSHDSLCNFLDKYGFPVERHYVTDTAFRATVGDIDVSYLVYRLLSVNLSHDRLFYHIYDYIVTWHWDQSYNLYVNTKSLCLRLQLCKRLLTLQNSFEA